MFILPKGTPLAESVPTSRVDLPTVLGQLRNNSFSGYARLSLPATNGVFLYIDGKLISVLFQPEGSGHRHDLDAVHATIENLVLNRDGTFSAYRLNREIAFALLAMFRGKIVLNAQEMKLIDFKAVLEKIRTEHMNACLKVYTDTRAGLIFYRDGAPIGFFDDSAEKIGTTQDEVRKIAGLPGARIDVQTIKESEEAATLVDLNDLVDIAKIWAVARENVFSVAGAPTPPPPTAPQAVKATPTAPPTMDLGGLQADLTDIAIMYLGKLGQPLLEKELAKNGGLQGVLTTEKLEELLAALEKGSKMLTNSTKIRQMQDAMRAAVSGGL